MWLTTAGNSLFFFFIFLIVKQIFLFYVILVSKGLTISESHVNVVLTILKDVGKVSKKDYLIDESSNVANFFLHTKEKKGSIFCF
jgi:hypothetical protein